MKIQGAIIKEQGVIFAIVVVKSNVLRDSDACSKVRAGLSAAFSDINIVLMAQDSRGTPTYQGRKDIVKFLSRIHLSQIPWKEYTLS